MRGLSLTRFAWLAVFSSLAVIVLKSTAWWITGSVGLFSDAVESTANLAGAVMAVVMLHMAIRPPDDDHAYGHSKAEYFASGFEGALILLAGVGILLAAVMRLPNPRPVSAVGVGLFVALGASALNLWVARLLHRVARHYGSITLEAHARHLMTDVWTSLGVIFGVGATALTGWYVLDPLIALVVGIHVLAAGFGLIRRSALGLLDTALPAEDRSYIDAILDEYRARGIEFHAIRTRRAGRLSFVAMHMLVPGDWTVQRGHDVAEELEERIRGSIPGTTVFTHLEPVEDPISFEDTGIQQPPL